MMYLFLLILLFYTVFLLLITCLFFDLVFVRVTLTKICALKPALCSLKKSVFFGLFSVSHWRCDIIFGRWYSYFSFYSIIHVNIHTLFEISSVITIIYKLFTLYRSEKESMRNYLLWRLSPYLLQLKLSQYKVFFPKEGKYSDYYGE